MNVCSQSVAVLTKRGWLDKDLPVLVGEGMRDEMIDWSGAELA